MLTSDPARPAAELACLVDPFKPALATTVADVGALKPCVASRRSAIVSLAWANAFVAAEEKVEGGAG